MSGYGVPAVTAFFAGLGAAGGAAVGLGSSRVLRQNKKYKKDKTIQ
jgi:hypothetical protein